MLKVSGLVPPGPPQLPPGPEPAAARPEPASPSASYRRRPAPAAGLPARPATGLGGACKVPPEARPRPLRGSFGAAPRPLARRLGGADAVFRAAGPGSLPGTARGWRAASRRARRRAVWAGNGPCGAAQRPVRPPRAAAAAARAAASRAGRGRCRAGGGPLPGHAHPAGPRRGPHVAWFYSGLPSGSCRWAA